MICSLLQDNIQGTEGGAMASAVYKVVHHGCKTWRSVAQNVLNHTTKPIIAMIRAWVLEVGIARPSPPIPADRCAYGGLSHQGTLNDPYQEFFITTNPDVPDHQFWHAKFQIRSKMLPSFIPSSLAQKASLPHRGALCVCARARRALPAENASQPDPPDRQIAQPGEGVLRGARRLLGS